MSIAVYRIIEFPQPFYKNVVNSNRQMSRGHRLFFIDFDNSTKNPISVVPCYLYGFYKICTLFSFINTIRMLRFRRSLSGQIDETIESIAKKYNILLKRFSFFFFASFTIIFPLYLNILIIRAGATACAQLRSMRFVVIIAFIPVATSPGTMKTNRIPTNTPIHKDFILLIKFR